MDQKNSDLITETISFDIFAEAVYNPNFKRWVQLTDPDDNNLTEATIQNSENFEKWCELFENKVISSARTHQRYFFKIIQSEEENKRIYKEAINDIELKVEINQNKYGYLNAEKENPKILKEVWNLTEAKLHSQILEADIIQIKSCLLKIKKFIEVEAEIESSKIKKKVIQILNEVCANVRDKFGVNM